MEIMGSEFIVEMVAGQRLIKGDTICTLEYIDGTDIDDEAAYSYADRPSGEPCGTCLRGGARGKIVLVEFPTVLSAGRSILLHTLKTRMLERFLAEKYPWHRENGPAPVGVTRPEMPADD